jgi:hypothetical protein
MAIGGVAFAASSGAQAPGSQTLTFKETEGNEGAFIDEKPLSKNGKPSIGDSFAFSNNLSDSANKRVGKLQAVCTIVDVRGRTASQVCQGVAKLSGGDLYLEAAFTEGPNGPPQIKGAITGGTGAYANARGTFTSVGEEVSTDTFVFTTS